MWPSLPGLVPLFLLFSLFTPSFCTMFVVHKTSTTISGLAVAPTLPGLWWLFESIPSCVCCSLCCRPALSETERDSPVLPLQSTVPLRVLLLSLAVSASPSRLYRILMFPVTVEKQALVLCFNKPEPKKRCYKSVLVCAASPGLEQTFRRSGRAAIWGGDPE